MRTLFLICFLISSLAIGESFTWPSAGGGSGTPGGTSGQVQYNNSGSFGGFGSWSGTNLSFGSQYLNGDGSLGSGSSQNATNSTAIGSGSMGLYGAKATGSTSLAVGFETVASGTNSIAIGVGDSPGAFPTQATVGYSLAIGYDTNSTAQFSVGVGPEVVAGGQNSFAAALGASTSGTDGIAIGHSAVSATDGLAIGKGANASYTESLAIGTGANTQNNDGIAVGYHASAGSQGIALGFEANGNADYAVAIGANANGGDDSSIAVGVNTVAAGSCVAIGVNATCTVANYELALGRNTYVNSQYGTVIGNNFNNDNALSDAKAPGGVTLGGMNLITPTANAENWLAIIPSTTANTPRMIFPAGSTTDDGSTPVQITGTVKASQFAPASAQTTLSGSAGSVICSEPDQGTSYKKVVCYLSGYTAAAQAYTFPVAFSHTPYVYGLTAGVSGATAATTTLTFTTTTLTGFVFAEGY